VTVAALAAGVVGALALAGCVAGSLLPALPSVVPEIAPIPPGEGEVLEGAMGEAEVELVNAIAARYSTDPNFGGFEWVRDDGHLILWWYGDLPDDLSQLLETSTADVEVVAPERQPAEVIEAVHRLTQPGAVPGVVVSSAAPLIDGSGIDVVVDARSGAMTEAQLRAALESVAGVPVVQIEYGSVVPFEG
jgi:hypothetical protein